MQTLKARFCAVSEQISELRLDFPHCIALSYGDRRMSFDEFDHRADRFAAHLAQLGVSQGGTVGLCMERSFDWIVAALGIMRTGAAYVPLDPAWPDERLRYAVNDSGATVLVARTPLLDRILVDARGIDPCRDGEVIAAAEPLVRRRIEPESVAYVIYTSGSTGVPKGVEITHANLAHLIRWHQDAFNITRYDRASHLAGLGFDAAVWEIWPNLCAGATLCLADDAVRLSPEAMQKWMVRNRVTVAFVPTVHAAPLMAMNWPDATALRLLLTGGDTLHQAPSAHLPFEVVNNYGPTECTVVATSAVLSPGMLGMPPIGSAIDGAAIYLMNDRGEPVSEGEVGEIYIGGGGVGRGYRNLSDATHSSFLPDPFSAEPGGRMFRTGDRGVMRSDGQIEFRGRLDRQTKIRGKRIELDEIGSVLSRHPSVDFAAAIATCPEGGENQLLGYVLPKLNARVPTVRELQTHLALSLPAFMIPSFFVRLQALPLSPNGKLDLAMLPQPTQANKLQGTATTAPASPIEEKLLNVARDLLECEQIAAHDNFFLAGGHSLLGMQLIMRVDEEFGVDLTLQELFEAPTIERLALLIDAKLHEERLAEIWEGLLGETHVGLDEKFVDLGGQPDMAAELQHRIAAKLGRRVSIADLLDNPTVRLQAKLLHGYVKDKPELPAGVVALQPCGTRSNIFWVHYLMANLAGALGNDHPFLSVALTAEDVTSLGTAPALESIAARLVSKVLMAQSTGPYTIGGFCLGGVLAFEIAQQLRVAGHEVSLLVLLDAPDPSFLKLSGSLAYYFRHPIYFLKRAMRMGPQMMVRRIRQIVLRHFSHAVKGKLPTPRAAKGQETIETAALAYRLGKYDGKVLLMLAADQHPFVNYLPAWAEAIPDNLHTQYVEANHREFTREHNLKVIADSILSHLDLPSGKESSSCSAGIGAPITAVETARGRHEIDPGGECQGRKITKKRGVGHLLGHKQPQWQFRE
jgi:amino acid adenylation domain-containing protein